MRNCVNTFERCCALLLIGCFAPLAARADSTTTAASLVGRRCLATGPGVLVQSGERVVGTAQDLEPIFQVVNSQGDWVHVESAGLSGWVRASEVVPLEKALDHFDAVVRSEPDNLPARTARGIVHKQQGDFNAAIADHTYVIAHDPRPAAAYVNRGNAFAGKGRYDLALADYEAAIKHDDSFLVAYNNLAWALATRPESELRDGRRAVAAANKACELTNWKNVECLDTLAAAYAETRDFAQAIRYENDALKATADGSPAHRVFAARLARYESNQPWREVSLGQLAGERR